MGRPEGHLHKPRHLPQVIYSAAPQQPEQRAAGPPPQPPRPPQQEPETQAKPRAAAKLRRAAEHLEAFAAAEGEETSDAQRGTDETLIGSVGS